MPVASRRADAERNRTQILAAAREALADRSGGVSMAEVARRAGVGMATLYRNFPGRRELLESLLAEEVDALIRAAAPDETRRGGAFLDWLRRFVTFHEQKHPIVAELLRSDEGTDAVFGSSRARVVAAAAPLLAAAQDAGEVRPDLALDQVLDLVLAVVTIPGDRAYLEPLVDTVLEGLRSDARRGRPVEQGP